MYNLQNEDICKKLDNFNLFVTALSIYLYLLSCSLISIDYLNHGLSFASVWRTTRKFSECACILESVCIPFYSDVKMMVYCIECVQLEWPSIFASFNKNTPSQQWLFKIITGCLRRHAFYILQWYSPKYRHI